MLENARTRVKIHISMRPVRLWLQQLHPMAWAAKGPALLLHWHTTLGPRSRLSCMEGLCLLALAVITLLSRVMRRLSCVVTVSSRRGKSNYSQPLLSQPCAQYAATGLQLLPEAFKDGAHPLQAESEAASHTRMTKHAVELADELHFCFSAALLHKLTTDTAEGPVHSREAVCCKQDFGDQVRPCPSHPRQIRNKVTHLLAGAT